MASKVVMDAVEARLATAWAAIVSTSVVGINIGGVPPADGSPFLTIEYPVANEEQISIGSPGSNVFRETGAFRIILSVPTGSGRDPYAGYLDSLRAAFRGQSFGGVNCWAPSPMATNDRSENGAYFEMSFAVPYYTDIFG